jgi:hypothetical protein
LCINNDRFPIDGELQSNEFEVTNTEGEIIRFLLPEPLFVKKQGSLPALVLLFQPGASSSLTVKLSKLYAIDQPDTYQIRFNIAAYYCDQFESWDRWVEFAESLVSRCSEV